MKGNYETDHTNADERFDGIRRSDGSVGVRDRVLVLPSVICSHQVADRIAEQSSVAVSTSHDHGCGQIGSDHSQTERTFYGMARNPNVAGTLVVGLGCEHAQSDEIAADLAEADVPVQEVAIQDAGGTEECIKKGTEAVEELTSNCSEVQESVGMNELTVGVVTSDLNDSTRKSAAPLVGDLVDDIVAAGGRVVVAGNERFAANPSGARDAVTTEVEDELETLFERHEGKPFRATRVARTASDIGFDAATQSWGSSPITEVLSYGERTSINSGVAVVDAPSRFEEATTALVAAGAQIVVHATGDGIVTGHPLAPTVTVTGDSEIATALSVDIDVDATEADVDSIRERLLAIASGEDCRAEIHGVTTFAITRVGPSM